MIFVASRIEVIDFKTFMRNEHHENSVPTIKQTHFFSIIPLNPLAFIDPVFLGIAAGILAIALLERSLAGNGHVAFAEVIYTFLKFAFPIIGFAALYFLLGQLRF